MKCRVGTFTSIVEGLHVHVIGAIAVYITGNGDETRIGGKNGGVTNGR
jgi:hypothetical protein